MADEAKPQILNKTLGEILQNNNQAQGVVMQAMQIGPHQLQELLKMTGNNKLMNMTIGELFKNGVVQKATGQSAQVFPQQFQQIVGALQNGQPTPPSTVEQVIQVEQNASQDSSGRLSFLQKIKNLFR